MIALATQIAGPGTPSAPGNTSPEPRGAPGSPGRGGHRTAPDVEPKLPAPARTGRVEVGG